MSLGIHGLVDVTKSWFALCSLFPDEQPFQGFIATMNSLRTDMIRPHLHEPWGKTLPHCSSSHFPGGCLLVLPIRGHTQTNTTLHVGSSLSLPLCRHLT